MNSITNTCSIDFCDAPRFCKGWCVRHYGRWYKHGDPVHSVNRFGYYKELYATYFSHTSEYSAWRQAIDRCYRTKNSNYRHYGGRGITVYSRWLGKDGFENFILDMDWKSDDTHTLDRIDNNKNYSPDNCRWTTRVVQQGNRRKLERNTSGYIGIVYIYAFKHWRSQIYYDKKYYYIGSSRDPEQAALQYDCAVIFFRGNDGITNIL